MLAAVDRDGFARMLVELRPKLHRYCARMTGSVVDGEDAVQEALVKAVAAAATSGVLGGEIEIENPEGWLFRIAHNAALDLLRRRARERGVASEEEPVSELDLDLDLDQRIATTVALRTFMRLGVAQRSSVILMDVLGYSLDEIAGIVGVSVSAVKALLHRGRTRLRELADEPAPAAELPPAERALLLAYIDRFNAGDFDAVRDMLAEEVRLDLVTRAPMQGKAEVQRYFHNYERKDDWYFVLGAVDGRPAAIAMDPADRVTPRYFVLLEWTRECELVAIRDFRYARYVMDGAVIVV